MTHDTRSDLADLRGSAAELYAIAIEVLDNWRPLALPGGAGFDTAPQRLADELHDHAALIERVAQRIEHRSRQLAMF